MSLGHVREGVICKVYNSIVHYILLGYILTYYICLEQVVIVILKLLCWKN